MNKKNIEATKSLRAVTTKALYSESLVAAPTIYDLAPEYLIETYEKRDPQLEGQIQKRIRNQEIDTISQRNIVNDIKIAVQHVAPIGLNIVRIAAIGAGIINYANPVMLILGGPALFMSGSNALKNLKRAFSDDPKIRGLIKKASEYEALGDLENAESVLKEALEVNVNPDNPRNGDIYLQLALLNFKNLKPRKALIRLSEAHVLFKEDDMLTMTGENGKIQISKRGYTELLACAAIDSFMISDHKGHEEWQETSKDFSRSAIKRFEYYGDKKESGVFGIFRKDEESAKANRALIAKVKFLQAKIDAKKLLGSQKKGNIHPALEEGVNLILEDTLLTDEERAVALLEQAQFYFQGASKNPEESAELIISAMMLTKHANRIYKRTNTEKYLFSSAETVSFVMNFIPKMKSVGNEVKNEILSEIKQELSSVIDTVKELDLKEKDDFILWAYDKIYKLSNTYEEKMRYINKAVELSNSKEYLASSFYSNLRKIGLSKDTAAISDLIAVVDQATKSNNTSVSAYGNKYLAEIYQNKNIKVAERYFDKAGDLFKIYAEKVKEEKKLSPFMVKGMPVIHSWKESYFAYTVLSSYCYIKSGDIKKLKESIRTLESTVLTKEKRETTGIILALRSVVSKMEKDENAALGLIKEAATIFKETERKDLLMWLKGLVSIKETPKQLNKELEKERSSGINLKGIEDFNRVKNELLNIIKEMYPLYDTDDVAGRERLTSIEEKLRTSKFTISVVGEFSTGKSTFINALLGEKVLPSSARPTTSAVNTIKYSPDKHIVINFNNKESKKVAINEVRDYITEKRNPNNEKDVKNVEVNYPSKLLEKGLVLLDTPGLGSLHKKHKEITYSIIPSCDAVILLTTSFQPYSESTDLFLKDLKDEIGDKVFIILNMIDSIEAKSVAEQQNFIKKNSEKRIKKPKIYPVSSYYALIGKGLKEGILSPEDYSDNEILNGVTDHNILIQSSRFTDLEKELYGFIANKKGAIIAERAISEVENNLKSLSTNYNTLVSSFDKEISDVRAECNLLTQKTAETQKAFNSIIQNLSEEFKDIKDSLLERLGAEAPNLKKLIFDYIDRTDVNRLRQENSSSKICKITEDWIVGISSASITEIEDTVEKYSEEINNVGEEFYKEFNRTFQPQQIFTYPDISLADINIKSVGLMDFAGSLGVGYLLGFMLGPVGIIASLFASSFISGFLQNKRNLKAKQEVKDSFEKELSKVLTQIKDAIREKVTEIKDQTLEAFTKHTDNIISTKEEELKKIMTTRDRKEEDLLPLKNKTKENLRIINSLEDKIKEIQ